MAGLRLSATNSVASNKRASTDRDSADVSTQPKVGLGPECPTYRPDFTSNNTAGSRAERGPIASTKNALPRALLSPRDNFRGRRTRIEHQRRPHSWAANRPEPDWRTWRTTAGSRVQQDHSAVTFVPRRACVGAVIRGLGGPTSLFVNITSMTSHHHNVHTIEQCYHDNTDHGYQSIRQ